MGRKVSGSKGKATEADHLAQVAKQLGKELAEIEQANADITGVDLSPWEVTIIKSLDNLWIKTTGEEANG